MTIAGLSRWLGWDKNEGGGVGNCSPSGVVMPLYEYECSRHGRFTVRQPMFDGRKADCPVCGEPAEFRISLSSFRMAEPITLYQDLGRAPDGSHRGYQVQGWKADSGISPKPGQPYKTAKEVENEA